jgi:hypothetical protein
MYDILEVFFTRYISKTKINEDLELCIERIRQELTEKLNEEERDILLKYADVYNEFNSHCSVENFKQGFWIGCRFMQEMTEL